jgi:hypothetical protein
MPQFHIALLLYFSAAFLITKYAGSEHTQEGQNVPREHLEEIISLLNINRYLVEVAISSLTFTFQDFGGFKLLILQFQYATQN